MFEHHKQPLLPKRAFFVRLARHAGVTLGMLLGSLGVGVVGYHVFERMSWLDSMLNASMLLGGMGPVNPLNTQAGKWFASFYALFAGVVFRLFACLCG